MSDLATIIVGAAADFWNPLFTLIGLVVAGIFAAVPSYFAYRLAMAKLNEIKDDQAHDRKIITETRDWVDGVKLNVLQGQWEDRAELARIKPDDPVAQNRAVLAKQAYDDHIAQRDRNVAKDVEIAGVKADAVAKADPAAAAAAIAAQNPDALATAVAKEEKKPT